MLHISIIFFHDLYYHRHHYHRHRHYHHVLPFYFLKILPYIISHLIMSYSITSHHIISHVINYNTSHHIISHLIISYHRDWNQSARHGLQHLLHHLPLQHKHTDPRGWGWMLISKMRNTNYKCKYSFLLTCTFY